MSVLGIEAYSGLQKKPTDFGANQARASSGFRLMDAGPSMSLGLRAKGLGPFQQWADEHAAHVPFSFLPPSLFLELLARFWVSLSLCLSLSLSLSLTVRELGEKRL